MKKKNKIKISSNRSFGIVFFVVFLIISVWPLLNENPLRIWAISVSIIFLILGLMNSKILTPLNLVWYKFGILLGILISPIVMGIVFFLVVTPTGFIMKILGKDLLNTNFNKEIKSYWINRDNSKTSMKKQF
tara:strand:- start:974 stop:1369 length:396 start_codon:yes stop_codon:yes gene_type:complete